MSEAILPIFSGLLRDRGVKPKYLVAFSSFLVAPAVGGTVILTERDSNHRKISMQIPTEWQTMAVNGSVERQRRPLG